MSNITVLYYKDLVVCISRRLHKFCLGLIKYAFLMAKHALDIEYYSNFLVCIRKPVPSYLSVVCLLRFKASMVVKSQVILFFVCVCLYGGKCLAYATVVYKVFCIDGQTKIQYDLSVESQIGWTMKSNSLLVSFMFQVEASPGLSLFF